MSVSAWSSSLGQFYSGTLNFTIEDDFEITLVEAT